MEWIFLYGWFVILLFRRLVYLLDHWFGWLLAIYLLESLTSLKISFNMVLGLLPGNLYKMKVIVVIVVTEISRLRNSTVCCYCNLSVLWEVD